MMNKALITGVTGQDGSFLAEFLLEKGYDVRSNALLDSLRYIYKVAEIAKFKQRILLVRCLLFLLFCIPSYLSAQDNKSGTVDIFMGVDFNYRDIYFNNRVYDILINLTPGVRWNMGHRWEVAAQALVPVVNQYGDRYKNVRLLMPQGLVNDTKAFVFRKL